MVKLAKIKGKQVISKNGMLIGKVKNVELDEKNWAITIVEIKLDDTIFCSKNGGTIKESIILLPARLMGPIGEEIYLNEKINDVKSLCGQIER